MEKVQIKDLYAGKPDAKDEINFDGLESFIKTFVVADNFDIEALLNKDKCFITGFKGTGKTALLFYLGNLLSEKDEATISSYVLFKQDYTEEKRDKLHKLSRRIMSSIAIEQDALVAVTEFEYIWRWLILKQIINDNNKCDRQLFVDNDEWKTFERIIKQIKDPQDTAKMKILDKIRLALPLRDVYSQTEFAPEIEIDLNKSKSDEFSQFTRVIDDAENAFAKLTRTDVPYFIFFDELEAYYGNDEVFKRDLALIRDLIISIKRFNTAFQKCGFENTKLICSVRSEIITAIMRFIVPKEINKITSGFAVPLNWNYTNSNSYAHPIMQIILKRIAVCTGEQNGDMLKVYKKWFPEKIYDIEPAKYILNNSWCKPRDIVRLIICAQHSLKNNSDVFNQAVFDSLAREYSEESLREIKEELHALYSPDEIDTIISCFTGFRTIFSLDQLTVRTQKYFPDSVLTHNLMGVLRDLYRLGFLGNYLPKVKSVRWQHKEDDMLILDDEWEMVIHYALHRALSIRPANDRVITQNKRERVQATISYVSDRYALATFTRNNQKCEGIIHITEFKKYKGLVNSYISSLRSIIKPGEKYEVIVNEIDPKYNRCRLRIAGQAVEE